MAPTIGRTTLLAAAVALLLSANGLQAQGTAGNRMAGRDAKPAGREVKPPADPARGREPRAATALPPAGGLGSMFRGRGEGAGSGALGIILRNLELFDSNHDGTLSREEFDAAAREVFDRLDVNADGKIDRAEMSRDLGSVLVRPSTRKRQLLRQYDLNLDGKISPEECLLPPKVFAVLDANKSGALEEDDLIKLSLSQAAVLQDPARRAAALISELDKNADRKLSADEWPFSKAVFAQADVNAEGMLDADKLKALPPLPLDHPLRRAEALIATMDEDGDKMLSQNEFRIPGARFEDADQNRDGLVDARELAAWFQAGNGRFGPQSPAEMADGILDRFDRNGDGKITQDEREGLAETVWARWDLNGDGVIEAAEIEKALSTRRGPAGPPPAGGGPPAPANRTRAELLRGNPAEIVKALDRDADGKLTAAELGVDQKVYERIDRDGDGKVTVEELAAAQDLLRTHGPEMRERVRDRLKTGHGDTK